jgi:hypothetical protein
MKTALRVILGAGVGSLVLWVSVYFYGLLAVWSPWPTWWWKTHYGLVTTTSKALALAPGVIVLGLFFLKLFKRRPILWALVVMGITLTFALADTVRTPELLLPTLRLTWELWVTFLVGPAAFVCLLPLLRSNQRLERP